VKRPLVALVATLVLLAACGSDDPTETVEDESTTTSSVAEAPAPERIVSMSATSTEMLFAIGAGEQVVAVDDQSNFPADAPITDLSAYEPNVEAISTYEPDLVVLSDGGELQASLEQIGIDVLVAPAAVTLDDTYDQLQELGEVTGHADEAAEVVDAIKTDIKDLVESVPERATPLSFYHELDSTLYSVTSETFIGQLYGLAGLENVADPADADGQSGGYPQLSAEFLVQADPDLVFLADTKCCQQDADTFAARPGFAGLSAVANDQVINLDDDIASRWGPRVVDLLRTIIEAVQAVPAA
jgi:iron complex transport system substrate-binding protein